MLLKPKYGRFRNESVTSSDDLMQSLAMTGKVVATPVVSSSTPNLPLPPLPPLDSGLRSSSASGGAAALADSPCLDGEQDGTTTFCMLIPKMPQWKFSNSLLSRSPSNSSSSSSKDSGRAAGPLSQTSASPSSSSHRFNVAASGPVASLAAVLNSCDPVCVTPCSLQAIRGQGALASANSTNPGGHSFGATEAMASPGSTLSCRSGLNRRTRGEGAVWLGSEEFSQKSSFIHKPTQGWLHPDKKIAGPGASYIVRYMGCIEVQKSMRSLDFNTRTQVTREAINRLCEAVPGGKGAWRKKALNKALQSIMGKNNLRFAGMTIAVNISIDGLSLLIPTTRQVIAHHPMQSISFASGGDTDTPDYVAYVAKDPVNQRACHILECSDGFAQSVISTIGQAFELQFKQYLHSPPKTMTSGERSSKNTSQMGLTSRRDQTPHPPSQLCYELHWDTEVTNSSGLTSDGYLCADNKDYEEHQYVNTQSLDNLESLIHEPKRVHRPFEDALKLHEASGGLVPGTGGGVRALEDQWPKPWYHSRMSRRDAEKLLIKDGDFLVRESTTNPGQYVLTGMHCGLPKHLLLVDPEGVVRTKDMLFESISHLISYHLKNELPIVAAESELHLKQVVRRKP
ncbi:hypothetical protein WMY93_025289 [Mugilogobius chulae]|uniref:SHC (Src homology 2 domain containing) transforming protein 2 n=1 Tax=Mugilogobius chulae TaxID=88201 RepID=A0AAW0N7J3_9GOBI